MSMGTLIKKFGCFTVADDGVNRHLYGVWSDSNIGPILIGSGMTLDHAIMVGEALDYAKAGNSGTFLKESSSKYI